MTVVIDRTRAGPPEAGPASAAEKARRRGDSGGGLYKPRTPIYPKQVHGRWRNIKWALMAVTLAIYYITPWIRWERPGALPDQAILVDFAGRRFYIFDLQFWPQEVYFITGLLVMAALALFLASSLFGRLWCGGYALNGISAGELLDYLSREPPSTPLCEPILYAHVFLPGGKLAGGCSVRGCRRGR